MSSYLGSKGPWEDEGGQSAVRQSRETNSRYSIYQLVEDSSHHESTVLHHTKWSPQEAKVALVVAPPAERRRMTTCK